MTTRFYFTGVKRQIELFIFFSLLILFVVIRSQAQDSATTIIKKEFVIGDGSHKKKVVIKVDDRVEIWLKRPSQQIYAVISSLTDSLMVIEFEKNPYHLIVPIWNISELSVIDNVQIYKAKIILTNSTTIEGLVKLNDADIELFPKNQREGSHSMKIAISEIDKIIFGKKAGVFIGMGIGATLGAIISVSSYTPISDDLLGMATAVEVFGLITAGSILGGTLGGLAGLVATGGFPRTFLIHGDLENYKKMKRILYKKSVSNLVN